MVGILISQYHWLPIALIVRSARGGEYWCASSRIDGTAMITRISTGTSVHDHLEQGVVGGPRRHRIGGAPEADDDDGEQQQDEQGDDGDRRHQDDVVEPGRFLADRRELVLEAIAAVGLADADLGGSLRGGGRLRDLGVRGRVLRGVGEAGRGGFNGWAGWACERAPIASDGPGCAGAACAAGAGVCAPATAGAMPSAAATARSFKGSSSRPL